MSPLIQSLLEKRGIVSESDIQAFLNPDYEAHTHAPEKMHGMKIAVTRILKAIKNEERIAVYADFDCDGIPGAAVLSDFFHKISYHNFEVYIPHRDREGYGFHQEAIQKLSDNDVKLIITVDVGTVAIDSVAFANSLGLDVIVTDHHEAEHIAELPKALAILNPKLGAYPFRDLCGAAVAFKLVQALIHEGHKRNLVAFVNIPLGWEKWLLDLVGIATIADMVPLLGENRVLAHFGLQVLRKTKRPGILALCTRLRLKKNDLTEDDIGFSIAPRINAASRMGEPETALRLLITGDAEEADRLAAHLEELNASRKGVVSSIVRAAKKTVRARFTDKDRVVVLGDTTWKPALLGLAANSIMSERGGIVCMWGRDAKGNLKGSCRSDGTVSLVDLFAKAGDVFNESGGHAFSGGFSVSHERVHTLPEVLAKVVADLAAELSAPIQKKSDAEVPLSHVGWPLYSDVTRLAPFGAGNPKPVFRIPNIIVTSLKRFGKEQNHVELLLESRESGERCRAFDFFRSPEDFTHAPQMGKSASVLATIERDAYRGGLALRLIDVVA